MARTRSKCSLVACLAAMIAALAALVVKVARAAEPSGGRTRAVLLRELAELERAHRQDPKDDDVRLDYARALYQSGEFRKALDAVLPPAKGPAPRREALALAGRLAYLIGRYDLAAKTFEQLIDAGSGKPSAQLGDKVNLAMVYYQTNRFDKIKEIAFPASVRLPNFELVKSFDQAPYQLSWAGEERVARVPFLISDPLPLLSVEFNGKPVTVIFDTGADVFILDPEIAAELNIKAVATAKGAFGGGKLAEFAFAKVDTVRVGEVTIKQVPIMTLPTKRFSVGFEGGKYTIGGFIGTAALRQFLATVDYEHAQMILRERSEAGRKQLRKDLDGKDVVEVPFALESTHMMMARGSLNDRDGLTFFVDSGLASEGAASAPRQTLQYAGIAIPETRPPEGPGGGGGAWASGVFPIKKLALGELVQTDLLGEFGARTPATYWEHGFIQDGLVSHKFLRQYASWTIDFERMRFVFAR
ncbi:MAG: aspartyl protease family protein [Pirellulales bacterium]